MPKLAPPIELVECMHDYLDAVLAARIGVPCDDTLESERLALRALDCLTNAVFAYTHDKDETPALAAMADALTASIAFANLASENAVDHHARLFARVERLGQRAASLLRAVCSGDDVGFNACGSDDLDDRC